MKILITGDKGYIGTNLKPYLQKHDIIGYDIINGRDICNLDQLKSKMVNIDLIVHLAGISGVQECRENQRQAFDTNINGTINVITSATEKNIPIIFASSEAIYGDSYYGLTKKVAEHFVKTHRTSRVLRLPNIWGGLGYLEKKNTLIARLNKGTYEDRGHGKEVRTFLHVNHLVKNMCRVIEIPMTGNSVINLKTVKEGVTLSVDEVLHLYKHAHAFVCQPQLRIKVT